MQYVRQLSDKLKYIVAILVCMFLITICMMSHIYARYTAEGTGSDSGRVALFGSTESITIGNDWTASLTPGSTNEYTLQVTNHNDSGTSEVAQSYTIEIQTAGNLPLTYTLKDGESEIGSFSETSTKKSEIFSTQDMRFAAGVEKAHTYTLQVKWPENKNQASLQGIPDFTNIIIHATQID